MEADNKPHDPLRVLSQRFDASQKNRVQRWSGVSRGSLRVDCRRGRMKQRESKKRQEQKTKPWMPKSCRWVASLA